MPLNFLRRNKSSDGHEAASGATTSSASRTMRTGIAFDGITEEWRLVGRMDVEGRLSDALNRREAVTIHDVQWGPMDGSGPLVDAPGLRSIDPYDLIIVLAGEGSLPELNDAERAAQRVHKVSYDVALEAPPFRIVGTVQLHPGTDPVRILDRSSEMFVPVVDAIAMLGDERIGGDVETVLVNRFYLRGVEQVDKRTGLKHERLPGAPLGGTTWQDRS